MLRNYWSWKNFIHKKFFLGKIKNFWVAGRVRYLFIQISRTPYQLTGPRLRSCRGCKRTFNMTSRPRMDCRRHIFASTQRAVNERRCALCARLQDSRHNKYGRIHKRNWVSAINMENLNDNTTFAVRTPVSCAHSCICNWLYPKSMFLFSFR